MMDDFAEIQILITVGVHLGFRPIRLLQFWLRDDWTGELRVSMTNHLVQIHVCMLYGPSSVDIFSPLEQGRLEQR